MKIKINELQLLKNSSSAAKHVSAYCVEQSVRLYHDKRQSIDNVFLIVITCHISQFLQNIFQTMQQLTQEIAHNSVRLKHI